LREFSPSTQSLTTDRQSSELVELADSPDSVQLSGHAATKPVKLRCPFLSRGHDDIADSLIFIVNIFSAHGLPHLSSGHRTDSERTDELLYCTSAQHGALFLQCFGSQISRDQGVGNPAIHVNESWKHMSGSLFHLYCGLQKNIYVCKRLSRSLRSELCRLEVGSICSHRPHCFIVLRD